MSRILRSQLRDALILALAVSSLATAQAAPSAPAPRPAGPPTKMWEKSLLQSLRPTPSGVRYRINVSESPVEAVSVSEFTTKLDAAGRTMVERRSGRAPGSLHWTLGTPWQQETHLGQCRFKNIDVLIGYDADVALMAGAVAQDSAAHVWWDRYADEAYATHLERLRLLRDSARPLLQNLRDLTNRSCPELTNIANLAAREARFEVNQKMRALGGWMLPLDDRAP